MSLEAPPEPFTRDDVAAAAAEFDVATDRLRTVLAAHQEQMARLPGVENLVYEWRKQFGATVIERTDEWYVVDAPAWAWEEFADDLDASETEMDALIALHGRILSGNSAPSSTATGDSSPMVLLRD